MLALTKFGHLHFDLLGADDAPVICMLHSLTSDAGMWGEQVPSLLKAGYQVLRLDTRGHGGSSPAPGDYTTETLAADVISVLDRLKFDAVHLIGLSLGGMIGQVIAADHPGRLLSLMACATAARWEGNLDLMHRRLAIVRKSASLEPIVEDNMQFRYSPAFRTRRPNRYAALRETFMGTSLDGYFGCMHAVLNHNVSERLPSVRIPTMVVAGSDDEITTTDMNKVIAQQVAGARYEEIAGGRHFLNVEFDEQFNAIMHNWLSGVV